MSDPLRYDPGCEPETLDAEAVMFQCPDGLFVKYADYARLKAEVERLKNNCAYLDQKLDEELDKRGKQS